MQLYVLNQKYLDAAIAESKASAFGWGWWEHKAQPADGTLLLDTRKRPAHLGLAKRVIKVLATCAPGNLPTTIAALPWQRVIGSKPYKFILTKAAGSAVSERELANAVWHSLRQPRVDLKSPEVAIEAVITSSAAHVGIVLWENREDFENRRTHLLPEMHPSGMHPALARAVANIACAVSVHDPFCGSGGLLIEAALSHKRANGADINADMVGRARANCKAHHLHPPLRIADATVWVPRCGAVIADLPYGKNTSPVALETLLEAFLARAGQSTRRAVIGVPHAMTTRSFHQWTARAHFTVYIHKSMTKHFYVLERN